MSKRAIPAHLEPAIHERLKQKQSVRDIAHWLSTEHQIHASYMAVHRIAERFREAERPTADLAAELAEARKHAGSQLMKLKALADQFEEMGVLALAGDEELGIKPNLELANDMFTKQMRAITTWYKTMSRLEDQVADRALAEARATTARAEAKRAAAPPPPPPQSEPAPEPTPDPTPDPMLEQSPEVLLAELKKVDPESAVVMEQLLHQIMAGGPLSLNDLAPPAPSVTVRHGVTEKPQRAAA